MFRMYGYGCQPNYEKALNWFERAAASGDDRFKDKAASAAKELNEIIEIAKEENQKVFDKWKARSDPPSHRV